MEEEKDEMVTWLFGELFPFAVEVLVGFSRGREQMGEGPPVGTTGQPHGSVTTHEPRGGE